jgi:Flp pilus assembly protein protease CpaA
MNVALALIMGSSGMAAGWFIPLAAQKTAAYKLKRSDKTISPDKRFTSVILKLAFLIVNGALWATVGLFASNILHICLLAFILLIAAVIIIVDIRIHIVPNEAIFVLLLAGLVIQFSLNGLLGILYAVITMLVVMVVFITLGSALGLNTIGAGDVKLAGTMGLLLGYPYIMYAMIGMAALLLVWCLGGLATRKLSLKSMFAFAPFMMAGTIFAIVANIPGY